MSKHEFDDYRDTYSETVEKSVSFSGLPHSFFQHSKASLLRRIVDRHLETDKRKRLVDVGCGVGALHPYIDSMFEEIHGIDVSAASIERAAQDNPGHQYQTYDGQKLPFDDGTFDMALAICVLHHVPPALWDGFLGEMTRVVAPGGLVCLIEHNPMNPLTRLSVARCPFDKDAVLLGAHEVRQRLREQGLAQVKSYYFLFLPTNQSLWHKIEEQLHWLPLGAQYAAIGRA